jgi:hypothetical protein
MESENLLKKHCDGVFISEWSCGTYISTGVFDEELAGGASFLIFSVDGSFPRPRR